MLALYANQIQFVFYSGAINIHSVDTMIFETLRMYSIPILSIDRLKEAYYFTVIAKSIPLCMNMDEVS